MEEENSFYRYCLMGGIVCILCEYPIPRYRATISYNISDHESNNKNHGVGFRTSNDARLKIEYEFRKEMSLIADCIAAQLPNIDKARAELVKHLGPETTFPFCSADECKILVHDRVTHKSKRHFRFCSSHGKGYMSKYWKKKKPKVLPVDFLLTDQKHFCSTFWNMLQEKVHVCIECDNNNIGKLVTYRNLLLEQEGKFQTNDDNIVLHNLDISKNSDLWLLRTGWSLYFQSYLLSNINKMTYTFDADNERSNAEIESTMKNAIKDAIIFVRNMDQTHQVFFEVERRPHSKYPNKPFAMPRMQSCERYITTICQLFRVIVRIYDYQACYNSADSSTITTNNNNGSPIYPPMNFTREQSMLMSAIKGAPQTADNYIEFLLSLVKQSYMDSPYECTLVCAISYVSLNVDGTYKAPSQFTPVYGAIFTVYKMLIIYTAMKNSSATVSPTKLVTKYTSDYLTHPNDNTQCPNVVSYLINLASYAFTISRNTPHDGFIQWENAVLIYQNVRLSMLDFRLAVVKKIKQAEELLVLLCEVPSMNNLPVIPWDSTFDNMNNKSYNYSFLSEPKNDYLHSSKLFNEKRNLDMWIGDNNEFIATKVKQLRHQVKSFLEILLCLVHITGGQPSRGTELTILQHSNSANSSNVSRNIFIDRSLVCIYNGYHKNVVKSQRTKDIFRFLPGRVSNLLVYYLWLVLPFYQKVVGHCENKTFKSKFLWTDDIVAADDRTKHWDSEKLSNELNKFFMSTTGADVNIAKYRHIAIAIVRKYLDAHIRTTRTSPNSDDMDDALADESEKDEPATDNIWDLQAGHATSTALNVYARTIGESETSSQTMLDKYRFISVLWHDFLFGEGSLHSSDGMRQLSKTLHDQRVDRFVRLKNFPLAHVLQQFIGVADAKFRGKQEQVLNAIANGQQYILHVAGTGSGKSLSFMLPAYIAVHGTTIVVVPLVSLQQDLVSRCTEKNISAKMWYEMDEYNNESIVFVTPESATTKLFLDFVNMLKSHHQLDRIFIDECHLLLSSTHDFRKKMDNLKDMLKVANVQLIMLTATLPAYNVIKLFQKLDITENVNVYRESTIRKNIVYRVVLVVNRKEDFLKMLNDCLAIVSEGRTIIYARSIRLGQKLSQDLRCDHYHAGALGKDLMLRRWMKSDRIPVIVATSALGCGLDVSDIRLVIHVGSPNSLCDFAQESGRAGRDGRTAYSVLINPVFLGFTVDDSNMNLYLSTDRCRRCILDSVLDGHENRTGCNNNEEECDNCNKIRHPVPGALHNSGGQVLVEHVPRSGTGNTSSRAQMASKVHADQVEMNLVEQERHLKKTRLENQQRSVTNTTLKNMVQRFVNTNCLVCEVTNSNNSNSRKCPNETHHQVLRKKARQRTMAFYQQYRNQRVKIMQYVVCFKCFCPQDICLRTKPAGSTGDCDTMFVLLDVIYLIAATKQIESPSLNDVNHMLKIIHHFAQYPNMIHLVKVFYDLVTTYTQVR